MALDIELAQVPQVTSMPNSWRATFAEARAAWCPTIIEPPSCQVRQRSRAGGPCHPSFPRRRESRRFGPEFWIPACAGMTIGIIGLRGDQ